MEFYSGFINMTRLRIRAIEIFAILNIALFLFLSQGTPVYAYDNKNVHPHIAEQGYYVWPNATTNDPTYEIHLFLGQGVNVTAGGCTEAQTGSMIREGAKEEDDYDPIAKVCLPDIWDPSTLEGIYGSKGYGFFHHFYDADIVSLNGLNNSFIGYGHEGGLEYAKKYWYRATSEYYSGNKGTAYWYLGRIAHLLADASVPAHVHNDPHDPISGTDSYETYMKSHYTEYTAASAASLSSLPSNWTLDDLFWNMAQRAQYFPSDNGTANSKAKPPATPGRIEKAML